MEWEIVSVEPREGAVLHAYVVRDGKGDVLFPAFVRLPEGATAEEVATAIEQQATSMIAEMQARAAHPAQALVGLKGSLAGESQATAPSEMAAGAGMVARQDGHRVVLVSQDD